MIVNAKQWQIQRPHIAQFQIHNNSHVPNFYELHMIAAFAVYCYFFSRVSLCGFFTSTKTQFSICLSEKLSDSFDQDPSLNIVNKHNKIFEQEEFSLINILKKSNSLLPHVVLASTLLALVYPPSFTWFTTRYYAPALGFLMFAVGVNSSEKDFVEAFKRPSAIFAGYLGQFIVKPILGYIFGIISVSVFNLPTPIGAGIMLVSCVSGAQLSNYATFLTDPPMAPLSIVMTSLSTATAVFVTPLLSLLLIGKRLPVDVTGMVSSILQIVVAPIAAGLLLNRFLPWISNAIRPFLPPLSVLVTACCVGAPLAINVKSVISPFGATILSLIISFHLLAFVAGYVLTGLVFPKAPDLKALQRTMSFETGMQSSLLALALANRFFRDPLVAVPPAISTVMMSLMGFTLVMVWAKKKEV
ncbi:sodium-bile acid cotransporter, putative [Ricinus communis]|uniref:Sodium-bile acid cotransporter, putative n=1 Tax=Ricinus communis TaxID=3988 RepID=B9RBV8_RICCO|nr:sodium-bile acid cotransporter, putative [Ricinus communis]